MTNGTTNDNLVFISAFVIRLLRITIPAERTEYRWFKNENFIAAICKIKTMHLSVFFQQYPLDALGSFPEVLAKIEKRKLL